MNNLLPKRVSTDRIWNEFSSNLKRFIVKRIPNKSDADDVLQDVFIKIHLNSNTLNDSEKLAPWIYTITKNTINDYYRKNTIQYLPLNLTIANENISKSYFEEFDLTDIQKSIQPFINSLPEIYKDALVSVDIERMSQKDFAELKGIGYSAAKSRVQRAREMLKEQITAYCTVHCDDEKGPIKSNENKKLNTGCIASCS